MLILLTVTDLAHVLIGCLGFGIELVLKTKARFLITFKRG